MDGKARPKWTKGILIAQPSTKTLSISLEATTTMSISMILENLSPTSIDGPLSNHKEIFHRPGIELS
jgi:hypothetical protein